MKYAMAAAYNQMPTFINVRMRVSRSLTEVVVVVPAEARKAKYRKK